MTTLEKFIQADNKVNEIENNGGLYLDGYAGTATTPEYDAALLESQKLYNQLMAEGIDPFAV